ncbi:hypothetical protein ACHAQA_001100 [Verticillium albo-atrum]
MDPSDQQPQGNQHQEVNGEYDEDAALEAAIALSLQHDTIEENKPTRPHSRSTVEPSSAPPIKAPASSSWLLDRKQMEDERLRRLRKRTAGEAALDELPVRRLAVPANSAPVSSVPGPTVLNRGLTKQQAKPLRFAKGAVKKTWVYGCPRTDDDIKIEEVLEKDKLELAVVSSFQWDESWFLSKVDIARTKMVFIAYANSSAEVVFLIDLPRLDAANEVERNNRINESMETCFGTELRRFLRAQGLDEGLIKSLDNFDFAETERYGFVHTIAGGHTDQLRQVTGFPGLSHTVRSLGLTTDSTITVDYVAGGTICFQEKWWGSATFPREMLRDSASVRTGVLMHDKIMFVQRDGDGGRDGPGAAWAYVGSANLSESAWGRLGKERGSGKAKLTCRNWECGVLVPTTTPSGSASGSQGGGGEAGQTLWAFQGTVPIPMSTPAEAYGISPGDTATGRPWFFMKKD